MLELDGLGRNPSGRRLFQGVRLQVSPGQTVADWRRRVAWVPQAGTVPWGSPRELLSEPEVLLLRSLPTRFGPA